MRKLRLLSIVLIASSFLISCEKKKMDDFDLSTQDLIKAGKVIITEATQLDIQKSDSDVYPWQIPGANNGGNITCAEVGEELMQDPDFFYCGEKIDYEEGNFTGEFPLGLNVSTDGTYVSFDMKGVCLDFGDGRLYKVGAVIVKGSDRANVYWYAEGSMVDGNLAAPINSSGGPAGLSNLTFCFVECEQPDLVIAVKSYVLGYGWLYSEGTLDYASECITNKLGINDVMESFSFSMVNSDLEIVGSASGVAFYESGNTSVIVTVDLINDLILDKSHIYVGPLSGIETSGCVDWSIWPLYDLPNGNIQTYSIY